MARDCPKPGNRCLSGSLQNHVLAPNSAWVPSAQADTPIVISGQIGCCRYLVLGRMAFLKNPLRRISGLCAIKNVTHRDVAMSHFVISNF